MFSVYGQKGDGPILHRSVTPMRFMLEWGRYARAILRASRNGERYIRDGHAVWIEFEP